MATVDPDKVVCGGIYAMTVAVLVDSLVIKLGQDACLSNNYCSYEYEHGSSQMKN
jgi:hypothetical protein